MERERRNVADRKVNKNVENGVFESGGNGYLDSPVIKMLPVASSSSSAGSPTCSSSSPLSSNSNYIQHRVSRFDTLAGVAIRYGVEVADIKRLNGLVTDIQMFALKYLQIPLPGRHPPSNSSMNDFDAIGESSSERNHRSEFFYSFQSLRLNSSQCKVSPAMSSLQGFYGLKSVEGKAPEGFEMATYRNGNSHYLEDGPFIKSSPPVSGLPLGFHRRSRSLASDLMDENGQLAYCEDTRDSESDWSSEKLVRRRQKSEADFMSRTPEKILKEEIGGGGFSKPSEKSLALRSKGASRASLVSEAESSGMNPIPIGLGDSLVVDGYVSVRKSSSTSSLHDQESGSLSSLWPTSKWSLKPDLQALSTAAITKPIFDGLPKPTRRTKAALD